MDLGGVHGDYGFRFYGSGFRKRRVVRKCTVPCSPSYRFHILVPMISTASSCVPQPPRSGAYRYHNKIVGS